MSEQFNQSVTIPCSKCQSDISTTICTSIESPRDKDDIDKILDGTFFIRKCQRCGAENVVNFPIGYKNTATEKSILFLPTTMTPNDDKFKAPGGARITYDMFSFIEKVRIAEMGLDDKIVELVKIAAYNQVAQLGQVPDEGLERIDCWVKDDLSIDLDLRCNGRHFLLEVPYKMYKDIKRQFSSVLNSYKDPRVVDLNWAIMLLNALTIEEDQSDQEINDDDWDEIVFE